MQASIRHTKKYFHDFFFLVFSQFCFVLFCFVLFCFFQPGKYTVALEKEKSIRMIEVDSASCVFLCVCFCLNDGVS